MQRPANDNIEDRQEPAASGTADTRAHGNTTPGLDGRRSNGSEIGALIERDYGETELKDEAMAPGDPGHGSNENLPGGKP